MPDSDLTIPHPDPLALADHLNEAISAIDTAFGQGYARDNPDLVASLVQSGSIQTAVATGYTAHQQALALADRIGQDMCETLLKLKPKFFG